MIMDRLGRRPISADVAKLRVLLGRAGLAQPSGWMPFTVYANMPYNLSGTGYPFAVTLSRAITLRSWFQGVYVVTTNNGSNYWTVSLHKSDTTQITSFDTSALSADTWAILSDVGRADALTVSDVMLYVQVVKTGSPGNLHLAGPAVFGT